MSYVTLDDLRTHAQIDDFVDDSVLDYALAAAIESIDDYCNRTFETVDSEDPDAKTVRTYTARSSRRLLIDDATAIDSVEVRRSRAADFVTVDPDDYDIEDGEVVTEIRREVGSWPPSSKSVRVTAWFGWPETPHAVRQATLLQAARFAQRRNAQFGIATVPGLDGGTGMRLLSRLDADVELMLNGVWRSPTRQPS